MVLFALCLLLSMFSSGRAPRPGAADASGCFKVNSCKCIMKDGSGVIDLGALGDADGFLGRLRPLGADTFLSFSPCLPFSEPGAECSDVASCLTVRYDPLGYHGY